MPACPVLGRFQHRAGGWGWPWEVGLLREATHSCGPASRVPPVPTEPSEPLCVWCPPPPCAPRTPHTPHTPAPRPLVPTALSSEAGLWRAILLHGRLWGEALAGGDTQCVAHGGKGV